MIIAFLPAVSEKKEDQMFHAFEAVKNEMAVKYGMNFPVIQTRTYDGFMGNGRKHMHVGSAGGDSVEDVMTAARALARAFKPLGVRVFLLDGEPVDAV